jgi:cystathionine gamma-synthase
LALRGIRTFPIRFRAAESNAKELVKRLTEHPKITKVRYPGFGAVISFEVDGPVEDVQKVCESSKVIIHATSLGGVESLWERRRRWAGESISVPERLIRLSVGCEHVEDLWSDIDQALGVL